MIFISALDSDNRLGFLCGTGVRKTGFLFGLKLERWARILVLCAHLMRTIKWAYYIAIFIHTKKKTDPLFGRAWYRKSLLSCL